MTIVEQLAAFSAGTGYADLPDGIADETKRIILDSIGCALAGTEHPKGTAGIAIGRTLGGMADEAVMLGTGARSSVLGAAFANGELINALDMDSVLPPGHVSPYVIPAALARAEQAGAPGADLVAAIAVAHEMSNRLGKAMDYLRDIKGGEVDPPKVYGYSSTIFGATAAALRVLGTGADVTAHGLGIAGCISPVNSHMAWVHHAPSTTIKYTVAGVMVQTALTAAMFAENGHRGDLMVLDDAEYGFPAMIGTKRWEPAPITEGLGEVWGFLERSAFKPYPHCHVLNTVFDVLRRLLAENAIGVDEIESIRVQGESFVEKPVWLNERIEHVGDAQFSIKHGIALAAHLVKPGKAWQDPDLVFSPSVMALMQKVSHEAHPGYTEAIRQNPAGRPTRVEIRARGQLFTGEGLFPKGTRSPDPETRMTTGELVAKFRHNGSDVMSADALDDAVDAILNLEAQKDMGRVMAIFVDGARNRKAA